MLLAAGDDRQHGGNEGYDDRPDAHYSWDNTVPNHDAPQVGDTIALWNTSGLLGVSVVEHIEVSRGEKVIRRCPNCDKTNFKPRKTIVPQYKCACGEEFDDPVCSLVSVRQYRSRHDAAWVDLRNTIDAATLRTAAEAPQSQHSIRALDWSRFEALLAQHLDAESLGPLTQRDPSKSADGHIQRTVRARLGQSKFRSRLLRQYGPICAFTGALPEAALEAAHLYSYAELGVHMDHGGLLMRRDLHTLFDRGWLGVNPGTRFIAIAPSLFEYPLYRALADTTLHVPLATKQLDWLSAHWAQHNLTNRP